MFKTVLLITCFTVLIISLLSSTNNFLDIKSIITDHFNIIKNNWIQAAIIYLIPIAIAIIISKKKLIDTNTLDNLNLVLSILISMFFSVLSILCSINSQNRNYKYQLLLKETSTSTIFEITICLLLLFISFSLIFIGIKTINNNTIKQIASIIVYYLTMIAILNIFMILKRIKSIFDNK